jgi:hypothetical protein
MLAKLLERRSLASYRLIVCGGSALLVAGVQRETTKDVDILASLGFDNAIEELPELPEDLHKAVKDVAGELDVDDHWLNTGPSSIINTHLPNFGLPEGFIERLTRKEYGPKLTIYYIGRLDQIFFKLYATVDKCTLTYHLTDLHALKPTESELIAAAEWSMQQDPSIGYKQTLIEMLEKTGYEQIAVKLK